MNGQFSIGTRQFHDDPNMNYTLNRVYAVNGGALGEVSALAATIEGLDDCVEGFLALARKAQSEGRLMNAAASYRGAQPVKAVLDHFGLEDVTLIGLSLGGYLAPRAAAREGRISRVVAWGVRWDFFGVVSSRRGKALEATLHALMFLHAARLVNALVRRKMTSDSYHVGFSNTALVQGFIMSWIHGIIAERREAQALLTRAGDA